MTTDASDGAVPAEAIPESALDTRMGVELIEVTAQRVVARMPVEGNTQPFGVLHGGANGVIAETVGSIGANIHAHSLGCVAMGVELSVTHHRSARSGFVTATGTPLSQGRTLSSWEIVIVDDDDRRLATGRLTCILRSTTSG